MKTRLKTVAVILVILALSFVHIQCEQPSTALPQTCLRLAKFQGDGQFGRANTPLTNSLIARVRDQSGQPRAGVPVTWTVTEGDGDVVAVNNETSVSGDAEAVFILGRNATQKVECRITQPLADCNPDSAVVTFTASPLIFSIQTPTASVLEVNGRSCNNESSFVSFTIPMTTNLPLQNYYVEVEMKGTTSAGVPIDFTTKAGFVAADLVRIGVCAFFGTSSWFDQRFTVKLYQKDSQGGKVGQPLFTSNQSSAVRLNRPAGAFRRSAENTIVVDVPPVSGL
ncbi:MAG: Ig-like domain-containing protein [Cytophagales bacterium]|jgi:hypothetical protein|nr:Ig-like domain-containing protein [Cytophagales bacterium]